MKETFLTLISYIKNPVLEKDTNKDIKYRLKIFGHLLIISLATGLLVSPLFIIVEELGLVNMDDHAMEELMRTFSVSYIFLFTVILAPLIEEAFFRAPLTLFDNPKSFKPAFYTFAIIFGLIHITNFTITTNVLLLAPILILPQTLLGTYLGFIRVRFGLLWSIALHACYNGILMILTLSADLV